MFARVPALVLLTTLLVGCGESKVQVKVKGTTVAAEDAAKDLVAKIETGKSDDRMNALNQLKEICEADPKQAVHFAAGLKHSDLATRMIAIRRLKDLGAKGMLAVPDLQAVAANEEEDANIKKEAREAIDDIQAAAGATTPPATSEPQPPAK